MSSTTRLNRRVNVDNISHGNHASLDIHKNKTQQALHAMYFQHFYNDAMGML